MPHFKDVLIVTSQDVLSANLSRIATGWIMLLQDDSIVDVGRIMRLFGQFVQDAAVTDVLLPYKTMDSCNMGANLNRGEFYRIKDIHSLRGMILHNSVVKDALRTDAREYWPEEAKPPRPFQMYHGDPLFMVRPMESCRPSTSTIDADSEGWEPQMDNYHNFKLPRSYRNQRCIIPHLTFYTIYPNAVYFDAMFATRMKELAQLNECAAYPSTIEQYIKDVTYDNIYTIMLLILIVCGFSYMLFANIRRRRGEVLNGEAIANSDTRYRI